MLEEFKEFALKGNLLEIAVGLVLALAFKSVIDSLVADIINQIIAAIFGQPDFSTLVINVGDGKIFYGNFINAVISFLLVAAALFFLVVKPYNAYKARKAADPTEEAPAEPGEDVLLLREIRDSLARS